MKYVSFILMCLAVGASANLKSKSKCGETNGHPCPFISESDLVTLADFQQYVVGEHWIGIYSSSFNTGQTFCRKGNQRWNDSTTGLAELYCFSFEAQECWNLSFVTTKSEDDCGRVIEKGDADDDIKFYSQDLSEYFWQDVCYSRLANGECSFRFLGLLVKAWRGDGDLDLQGLPWELITADLWNNFGLRFSGPIVKFSWKDGPDCGFTGIIPF
ncbi:uncharacterized protein LOC132744557 [Ruditapes philippinarum]|uniref:uncharacterized protein LOC132744557 n=1 Tax=Ruditapes philippinarum TaxID=129788 RepID=UPI00295BDBAD|nr:uncharacterized protein LOC132744557 [Ruditapes philippinarum]